MSNLIVNGEVMKCFVNAGGIEKRPDYFMCTNIKAPSNGNSIGLVSFYALQTGTYRIEYYDYPNDIDLKVTVNDALVFSDISTRTQVRGSFSATKGDRVRVFTTSTRFNNRNLKNFRIIPPDAGALVGVYVDAVAMFRGVKHTLKKYKVHDGYHTSYNREF